MAAMSAASADSSVDSKGRLCQFTKTKICKFNVLGKCTKGEECPFAHEGVELRRLPDLRCTKLCKMLIQTGQCGKKSCMYAHSKEELRSTGAYHKTKLCRFMQTGHCTLGAKCNFAHSAVELREPETIDDSLESPPGLGGWESVLGGLLSDDEDDAPGMVTTPLKPTYAPLPRASPMCPWTVNASSISEESTECGEESFGASEAAGLGSPWDYQNAMDFQLGALAAVSGYPPDAAYGGFGMADPYGIWSGNPMVVDPYANALFANPNAYEPWDWRAFGDNVVIDQKDESLRLNGGKPSRAVPKMRSVRTSESTICTLGDAAQL